MSDNLHLYHNFTGDNAKLTRSWLRQNNAVFKILITKLRHLMGRFSFRAPVLE